MRLTTICNSLEDDQVLCVAGVQLSGKKEIWSGK